VLARMVVARVIPAAAALVLAAVVVVVGVLRVEAISVSQYS